MPMSSDELIKKLSWGAGGVIVLAMIVMWATYPEAPKPVVAKPTPKPAHVATKPVKAESGKVAEEKPRATRPVEDDKPKGPKSIFGP